MRNTVYRRQQLKWSASKEMFKLVLSVLIYDTMITIAWSDFCLELITDTAKYFVPVC